MSRVLPVLDSSKLGRGFKKTHATEDIEALVRDSHAVVDLEILARVLKMGNYSCAYEVCKETY